MVLKAWIKYSFNQEEVNAIFSQKVHLGIRD